jgi:hypothetical protein
VPWPRAGKENITWTDGRGHHFSYHVGFEAGVHQSHSDGGHDEAFPADAIADDPLCREQFLPECLELRSVNFGKYSFKLLAGGQLSVFTSKSFALGINDLTC